MSKPDPDRARLLALIDIAMSVRAAADAQVHAFYRELRALAEASRSKAALRSLERDLLVEFHEGVGPEVERFWAAVGEAGLALARKRDVLVETLARGAVRNMDEYVALEDAFEALQRCGKLGPDDAARLAALLDAFAAAPKNRAFFADAAESPGAEDAPGADASVEELAAGRLVRVSATTHRYDYVGLALTPELHKKGYQGGGETWAGLARGLIALEAPALEGALRLDPEADCLAVWADDEAPLRALDALFARAQTDQRLLRRALTRAAAAGALE